jgi:hypothetical protein
MSDTLNRIEPSEGAETKAQTARHFPATLGRFDDPADRETIDGLVQWVEAHYRDELRRRPSMHVYVRILPESVTERIDRLRDGPRVRALIESRVPAGSEIVPMKHTDELYLSHYNKDRGGDQGLFDKHYDGNLRFLSGSMVVRALIYLQSDASYKVVFHDSGIEKAFATYEFGLLDFHRELHWVEGRYDPADRQRILLKCNYLVSPRGAPVLRQVALAANTGVFYVVKAAMEYSKSPRTLPQVAVGHLCNIVRRLNNIHPLVPLGLAAAAAVALVMAVATLLA